MESTEAQPGRLCHNCSARCYDLGIRDQRFMTVVAGLKAHIAFAAALLLLVLPIAAQEPRPLIFVPEYLGDPEGVSLDYAWRFSPDAGEDGAAPSVDDSSWRPLEPELAPEDLTRAQWRGSGWFRRHLIVDPALQRRPIALRFSAPGVAQVWLDGRLILETGGPPGQNEFPGDRRDSAIITFDGPSHLLAVRYRYPSEAARAQSGIGFKLILADPQSRTTSPEDRNRRTALLGAMAAIPIFLAFLHLALVAFDRRGRENLFYALQMAAVAAIVLRDAGLSLFRSEALSALVDAMATPAPILVTFFGLMTYYAIRTDRLPRSWIPFAIVGAALTAASYFIPAVHEYGWMAYFTAMVLELIRLERSGSTRQRRAAGFFVVSYAVFLITVALQILVNLRVIAPIFGIRNFYLFGVLASAIGMSLYLARTMGQARVIEAEHERKTAELARARELQLSMLPQTLPAVAGLDVAAATQTAAEVGGDYYDAREIGDGTILMAFGDATGHGLSAGIMVTAAKALFESIDAARPLGLLLATFDSALRAMRLGSMRMALLLARISAGEVAVATAAMPPALIHRAATDTLEEAGAGGLPLGTALAGPWEESRAALNQGDTILLASDGLAELLDPEGRQLGYDGVRSAFQQAAKGKTAAEVLDRILAFASGFRGSRPLEDDMTLVIVRRVAETNT